MDKKKKSSGFYDGTDVSSDAPPYQWIWKAFGGQLMQWIDELAGIVSIRHAGGRITTASIDNLNFKAGAYLNDTIVLIGRITIWDALRWRYVSILMSRILKECVA